MCTPQCHHFPEQGSGPYLRGLTGTFCSLGISNSGPLRFPWTVPSWRQVCRFVVLGTSQRWLLRTTGCCWWFKHFVNHLIRTMSTPEVVIGFHIWVVQVFSPSRMLRIPFDFWFMWDFFSAFFYLEPNWPLFLRGWPSIIGSNHPKFCVIWIIYHVIYIYIYIYIITCIQYTYFIFTFTSI